MGLSEADYQRADATELAQWIRQGDVDAVEVLNVAIALIERENPTLNGVVHPLYDQARQQLAALQAQGKDALSAKPFAGVPLLLKDLGHHLQGTPHTRGNAALRDANARSDADSVLVAQLADAGFLFPGKTNVPEFGLLGTTEPAAFGPARNPFDTTRTPGGSSGGSAAMVAAGAVPLATANDGGGSIRIPASYCGLVGLKPSRGRVSNAPHYSSIWDGLNSDLVVSRSVRDTVSVYRLLAGAAPGDPGLPMENGDSDQRPLRIAVCTEPPVPVPVDSSAIASIQQMATLLDGLGHQVDEASPDIDGEMAMDCFSAAYMGSAAADYLQLEQTVGKANARRGTEAPTRFLAYLGRCLSAAEYVAAKSQVNAINRAFGEFFTQYDVYLTPTTAGVAHTLGATATPARDALVQRVIQALRLGRQVLGSHLLREAFLQAAGRVPFTQLANLSGLPSISVPSLPDPETQLPLGAMFTAAMGNEAVLLGLAQQIEAAQPWIQRYPYRQ